MIDTKHCLICQKSNKTLHWHSDPDSGDLWVWCCSCNRGYSLQSYCFHAGISLTDFLQGDFQFEEAQPNEVKAQAWPIRFIPMSDPRSEPGVNYVNGRGLSLEGDMYYDIERNGIVFPYYFGNHFCGAQTRFIVPRVHPNGDIQKMDTMPGTRLGLLFYNWSQSLFVGNVKGIIVTEGAFNALSIQQALNRKYGGIVKNPWRCISCSGSGATQHHRDSVKDLKDQGMKVIIAFDSDDAGFKGLKKFKDSDALTHYALTDNDEMDWNDALKQMGHTEFAGYFLSKVQKDHGIL